MRVHLRQVKCERELGNTGKMSSWNKDLTGEKGGDSIGETGISYLEDKEALYKGRMILNRIKN